MNGKKTYITAVVALVYAGWHWYIGDMPLNEAISMAQVALTGAFVRHAIG